MKKNRRQQDLFDKDLRLSIILTGLLMLSVGRQLVDVRQSIPQMIFALFVVTAGASPLIFLANPSLTKAAADSAAQTRRISAALFLVLILLTGLFAFLTGRLTLFSAAFVSIWTMGSLFFNVVSNPAATWQKGLMLIWLWLPFFFKFMPSLPVPSDRPLIHPPAFAALIPAILICILLPRTNIGFSFRLKGEDVRQIVLNFILLFLILLILAPFTGLLSITDHLPAFNIILTQGIALFFLTILPEELLFRGVIYKYFLEILQGKRWAVGISAFASALIFGLIKARSPLPPDGGYFFAAGSAFSIPYALFSIIAGLFYVWIFIRTKKIAAAVWLHFLIDWMWYVFFRG